METTPENRTFGRVRMMIEIGKHPDHRAIRERTEARVAALKSSGNLVEDRETKDRHVHA